MNEVEDVIPVGNRGTIGFGFFDDEWKEPKVGLFTRINRAFKVLRYGDWEEDDDY